MTVRQTLTAPLAGALQSAFAGGGLFGLFHEGGIAGERPPIVRYADPGIEQASGWSVDATTGLVTFAIPPAGGVEVTADLGFDVPVRFDTDHMAVTIETFRLHRWQQIPILALRT